MTIALDANCDECSGRMDEGAYAYCKDCWNKLEGERDELLIQIGSLEDEVRSLENRISELEAGE